MADVQIDGGGTVYVFHLLTDEARKWWAKNVGEVEPFVEHRYAQPIAEGMQADGLIVE